MAAKRILILYNRIPYPLNDGGNIAVNAMIEGYHNAGWEVFLLAMNTTRHYIDAEKLRSIYNYLDGFETVDIDNNLKPLGLLKNFFLSTKPNHADRFFHPAFTQKLQQVISSFKPDVVQVENIYLAEYLPAIKAATDALTVLRLHNIEYQVWGRLAGSTHNPVKGLYLQNLARRLKSYERKVWKAFDLLLPITDTDKQTVLQSEQGNEILTVPVGLDFDKIPLPTDKVKWESYHIGAMDWQPNAAGIWWFIHNVWPSIHKEFPHFKFYFAGRNMPEKFKELEFPNVICEGEVTDANKFIADKKILFVPLHSGGGIRVKILEAMAQGKLVISTDVGMQGIEAVWGKHYLSANTPDEFVLTLKWALNNKEKATEVAANATSFVRTNYDSNTIFSTLINKIDNALTR